MSKIVTCFGCNKKKKLNSRHYCISCWKKHQELVPIVAKKIRWPVKIVRRFSLKGLNESISRKNYKLN